MFSAGKGTLRNIKGTHHSLRELVMLVFERTGIDFIVLEGGGLRTDAQAASFAAKGTGVLKSRHLTGDAVDFVPYVDGKPSWKREHCEELMLVVYECADELSFVFIHGADWNCNGILGESKTKEWDWPHIQRPYFYQEEKALAGQARRFAAASEEKEALDEAPDTDRNEDNDGC